MKGYGEGQEGSGGGVGVMCVDGEWEAKVSVGENGMG